MSLRALLLRTVIRKIKFINVASVASRSNHEENHGYHEHTVQNRYYGKAVAAVLFGSVLIGSNITDQIHDKKSNKLQLESEGNVIIEAGTKRPDLPSYSAEEVSKHDNTNSFWVTYKHGVYDVTEFLSSHPGGEQILNAAGLSIEPFWNVYGMHKTREVYKLLESYRIGNLNDEDLVDHSDDEMWAREPARDSRLIVRTPRPFNAETPPRLLVDHFHTPNELFYVRQHMPVPEPDLSTYRLRVIVKGAAGGEHEFALRDLQQFPQVTLSAALMCAGNRRSEMDKVKPVKGISWTSGAISNASWSGVMLRDLLVHCGVDVENTEGKHVIFTGMDTDATGVQFSSSIPLAQAVRADGRVLVAARMNGRALPPDHGRPLRAVVPGAPAVRSVKWLESITISEDESPSHWHQKDYRAFNPSKTWETADFSTAPPVYSLPVTSAICDPADGDTVQVKNGCIEVKGYAYSGGGACIIRVDLSTETGRAWSEARLQRDAAPPHAHYAWTLWRAALPVPPHAHEVEIWVKATDSNFNTQPEKFDDIWNIRGILGNAYHKIKVKLVH